MGALTCVLEDNTCFEAEMYADEYSDGANIEFKEDQRSKCLTFS
jgi:WD repeat-containing protein 48